MKVIVHTPPTPDHGSGAAETFDSADGWHIDEERQLHIKKAGGGNLAAFGVHAWSSVRVAAETA